jgi:hypothetical protein
MQLGKATGHFRANSKALAENEGDGIAKVILYITAFYHISPCTDIMIVIWSIYSGDI